MAEPCQKLFKNPSKSCLGGPCASVLQWTRERAFSMETMLPLGPTWPHHPRDTVVLLFENKFHAAQEADCNPRPCADPG